MVTAQTEWVDFKAVKAAVTIDMVLQHYGVKDLKRSKDELRGPCPIHQGDGSRAFHANLVKNNFQCFSCKARGNVLDFVAAMEKCSVRDAALKLAGWFGIEGGATPAGETKKETAPAQPATVQAETMPAIINPVLSFQLKINGNHPYGQSRGLTQETLEHFGAGLCISKGMFAGRYVLGLHNERGELVGYAGRSIDDSEPRYLFPSSDKGFYKRYVLFNLHRVLRDFAGTSAVVVVEGFFSAMLIHQLGFPCVSLCGSVLTDEQRLLLARYFNAVFFLLDGDDAGRNGAGEAAAKLVQNCFVKITLLSDATQPDTIPRDELLTILHGGVQI